MSKGTTNTSQKDDGPCKNCLQTLEERERLMVEQEDLKRQLALIKRMNEQKSLNDSMSKISHNNSRKDSMMSAASELKRNPVEDLIMQKSNQMLI